MNREMVQALRDKLAAEASGHDQGTWARVALADAAVFNDNKTYVSCATAACAAGHACLLAGDEFVVNSWNYDRLTKTYTVWDVRAADTGREMSVDARAMDVLDLSYQETSNLFNPDHSHNETIALLDQLLAGEDISTDDDEWR